jgi:tripartite-type tricarboxylate transporter receptor subunit TctC
MRKRRMFIVAITAILIASKTLCFSQEAQYPSRPVVILVPFTAGTEADILARLYAAKLSTRTGFPFVVENRPGAAGILASQSVLNAPPDGYLLLLVSSAFAINPAVYANLTFDTRQDFSGIALIGSTPAILVTNPTLGVNTQSEFIALAKQRPGQLNFGSAGTGSGTYFACRDFISKTGIDLVGVPYKGVQEYLTEIISGRLQLGCPPVGLAIPQVRAGKLVALSVTSKERIKLLPDVQTTSEAGLSNFEAGLWYGLIASSKTPRPIVAKLAHEILAINKLEDIREALNNDAVTPTDLTGKEFDDFIGNEIDKYRSLATTSGIQIR